MFNITTKIQSWADKKFARGIAKAMRRTYLMSKNDMPEVSEEEILKKVLSMRPTKAAKNLLLDNYFWDDKSNINLWSITFTLIMHEYRRGYYKNNLLPIPRDSMNNLTDALREIIGIGKNS